MAQFDFPTLDPNVVSGSQLASWLNAYADVLSSTNEGFGRPNYILAGGIWADSSDPAAITLRLFDGSIDIPIGRFPKGSTAPPYLPMTGGTFTNSVVIAFEASNADTITMQSSDNIWNCALSSVGFIVGGTYSNSYSWFGISPTQAAASPNIGNVLVRPRDNQSTALTVLGLASQNSNVPVVEFHSADFGQTFRMFDSYGAQIFSFNSAFPAISLFQAPNAGIGAIRTFKSDRTTVVMDANVNGGFTHHLPGAFHEFKGVEVAGNGNVFQTMLFGNPAWGTLSQQTYHQPNIEVGWSWQIGAAAAFQFTNGGVIRCPTGTVVASDKRLKHDILSIDNAAERVYKLQGYTYGRSDIPDMEGKKSKKRYGGLIAQEVVTVLPEAVSMYEHSQDQKQTMAIDYNAVTALLVSAVSELTGRVKELEKELKELKKS